MAPKRRKPPSADANAKTYAFHQPKPKRPKSPKPHVDRKAYVVHRPEPKHAAPPGDGVRFAKPPRDAPTVYTFHQPKAKQPDRWKPKGSAWTFDGDVYLCNYGCKAIKLPEEPDAEDWHAYNCPYWFAEGIDEAPF